MMGVNYKFFEIMNGHEYTDPDIFSSKLRQVKEPEDMTSR